MNKTSSNPYADMYFQKQIETASKERLILLLYDGLLKNLFAAQAAIGSHQIEPAHKRLVTAQGILGELARSLNHEAAPELAKNLLSLYEFMIHLLVEANLQKNSETLKRVIDLITPLREAWAQAVMADIG